MTMPEQDPTRLVLLGDLRKAMGLATELVRGSAANIAIEAADSKRLDDWCRSVDQPVLVDVAVNLPDVMARLRGERAGNPPMRASVEDLVGRSIDEVERALILQTLDHCRGNRTSAASILGISVRTMRNKLKMFRGDGAAPDGAPVRH